MFDDDPLPAFGVVLSGDRGSLPFALLHGESLVACAAWALGAAGVEIVDPTVAWDDVRGSGRALVLHDSLCPATPPAFVATCVREAEATGAVVVAVRPVTDTLKHVDGDLLGGTVDRESVLAPASPVVLPATVVASLAEPPRTDDPVRLVEALTHRAPVSWIEAPASARRVVDVDDLAVLAASTR